MRQRAAVHRIESTDAPDWRRATQMHGGKADVWRASTNSWLGKRVCGGVIGAVVVGEFGEEPGVGEGAFYDVQSQLPGCGERAKIFLPTLLIIKREPGVKIHLLSLVW